MYNDDGNIGRLKKTTDKKCPDCKRTLQLRVISAEGQEKEFYYCPICKYRQVLKLHNIKNLFREGEFIDTDNKKHGRVERNFARGSQ